MEILQLDFGFKISLLFSATKGHLYLLVGQNVSEIIAKKVSIVNNFLSDYSSFTVMIRISTPGFSLVEEPP